MKNYKIAQYLPNQKISKTFDEMGGNEVAEIIDYTYNMLGFVKTQQSKLSNGKTGKTEFFYTKDGQGFATLPGDILNGTELGGYMALDLSVNNLIEKIQINNYVNNDLISCVRKTFTQTSNGLPPTTSPKSIKSAKGNNSLETNISYDFFDTKGNVLQYTIDNGTPVTMIWGYNKTKMIAKIENVLLSNLSTTVIANLQSLSNLDFDHCIQVGCIEQLLRVALNDLRANLSNAFPDAMMTSYTHDPLIGVTSITDPKGDAQYYFYDDLERLEVVKDKDGNILSENQYHFKY